MGRRHWNLSAFVESSGGLGTVAHSTARLFTDVPLQVRAKAAFTTRRGWSADSGTLAITGSIHLPALNAEFLFRKGPEKDLPPDLGNRATATIVPAGHAIPIPPQRLSIRPRSESELYVRVGDPGRHPAWTEHFVGRCSAHPMEFDRQLPVKGTLHAAFTPEEFEEERRTRIEMGGVLRFERGLTVRLVMRDPGQRHAPPAEVDAGEVVLLPPGVAVPIARQVVWGLAGPNPWVSLRLLEANGALVGEEHWLGRSVRMDGATR